MRYVHIPFSVPPIAFLPLPTAPLPRRSRAPATNQPPPVDLTSAPTAIYYSNIKMATSSSIPPLRASGSSTPEYVGAFPTPFCAFALHNTDTVIAATVERGDAETRRR